jgi:hypothetical protein
MARRVTIPDYPYLRLLFYGKPGSTKTRTAASASLDERTAPVLMLNAAGNPLSIRDYDPAPTIIDLEELADVNAPYDWIRGGQKENHPFCKKFELEPPYKTLIVDQLTDLQRMSFAHVTGSKNIGPGDYPQRVQRQHFGSVLSQMVNFAKLYFSLPIHVIMTALEKTTVNDMTGAVTYSPLLWGQSDTEVPGYSYVVARLVHRSQVSKNVLKIVEDADKNTVSVAFFIPGGTFYAKDQYGALGTYMADPSIARMVDLIYPEA